MDAEIRPITDADVAQVVDLWHAAGIARPWNDPARDIAFARSRPHCALLVAVAGAKVLASAMVGEDGHRGWVYYVAALPDRQGTGLGRGMMTAAEAWLKARGVWKVQLLVRADNARARGFYEGLGYTDTRSTCYQKVLEEG